MANLFVKWLAFSWLLTCVSWAAKLRPENSFGELTFDSIGLVNRADEYWLEKLGSKGKMPLAPDSDNYKFFRNVKDYGAKGDGETDDTDAINRAASEGDRCGLGCAGTSTAGALIYFPPGTYMVKKPVVQYYYTQFVGDPNDRPVVKAHEDFKGVAIFDTDPYIPGANGAQWYINQNQFFRQIRNFVLDMRDMKEMNYDDDGQGHVPVGIHWQVAQATSLQNIKIQMREDGKGSTKTAIGIFTENGSGGFVSDLEISGGFIGFQVGSQQFTMRNLKFSRCLNAVQVTWTWGITWQRIDIVDCIVGFNITGKTPDASGNGQGVGSLAIIDSSFESTIYAVGILPLNGAEPPELVLDNVLIDRVVSTVVIDEAGGQVYLEGAGEKRTIQSWALGTRYVSRSGKAEIIHGLVNPAPAKPSSLIDEDGKYFVRSKPNYGDIGAEQWLVVTDFDVKSDGTGDQTDAINTVLARKAPILPGLLKTYVYFPAGIYQVMGTVEVPPGTIIVGSGWSNIRATGSFFGDMETPRPVVQVGKPGDVGVVEISDMMFTVKGPTAGAILMEWNIKAFGQGNAAMWDSHFRIGGAVGTDLSLADCPSAGGLEEKCIAASMLLHVTHNSSGYFENVWAWTADHDIDAPIGSDTTTTAVTVNIFSARGVLIESQGPTWLYGTASEHNVLYQYEFSEAKNIYMGHFQTETPYFQPVPNALVPFPIGKFPADPEFEDCNNDTCKESWGLRIIDSENIFIYSAGMYSFFNHYDQACLNSENCQERVARIEGSKHVWMFNIFTKGTSEVMSGFGEIPPVPFNFSSNTGFTSEIGVYLPFAGNGSVTNATIVYIDEEIWTMPTPSIQCDPPCVLVLPPSTLETETTMTFPPLTTTLEVGWATTIDGTAQFTTTVQTTTITIPAVTTSVIDFWNYNLTSRSSSPSNDSFIIFPFTSIQPPPFTITQAYPSGVSENSTRTIFPPPWPYTSSNSSLATLTTSLNFTIPPPRTDTYSTTSPTSTIYPVTDFVSEPTTTLVDGEPKPVIPCHAWFIFSCPPDIKGWTLDGWAPGIYPPGPPPPLGPPPPGPPPIVTLPPIPWPEITIGSDLVPTYSPYDPEIEPCDTEEVEFCATTVSIGTLRRRKNIYHRSTSSTVRTDSPRIEGRQEPTRTTATVSTCLTVAGCQLRGSDFSTTTTPEPSVEAHPYVIYPSDTKSVGALENALRALPAPFYQSRSPTLGTMFFFLYNLNSDQAGQLEDNAQQLGIQDIYVPHGRLTRLTRPFRNPATESGEPFDESHDPGSDNVTQISDFEQGSLREYFPKRASDRTENVYPGLAAVSWGPGDVSPQLEQTYKFDDSQGEGTFIYSIDFGAMLSQTELSELQPRPSPILTFPYPPSNVQDNDNPSSDGEVAYHGTCMMSKMAGKTLGIARKATIAHTVINYEQYIYEHFIDGLLRVHDIIKTKGHGKKSVVNMSLNFQVFRQALEAEGGKVTSSVSDGFPDKMAIIIKSMIEMGVVVVTGSGNRGNSPIDGYPAKFKDPADRNHIPDLLVAGSTTFWGQESWRASQRGDYIDIWAPGDDVHCTDPALGPDEYRSNAFGTSIASAVTAGLASYLRGLIPDLATARDVIDLVKRLSYERPPYVNMDGDTVSGIYPKMVWNGQTSDGVSPCIRSPNGMKRQKSDQVDVCILPGSGEGTGKPITFSSGIPSPTCAGGGCGSYCTGFFCSAPCSTKCGPPPDNPTQTQNPGFLDPGNPDSCQNPESPNFGNCNDAAPIAPPCRTTTISGTVGCYTSSTPTPTPTTTPTTSPTTSPTPDPTTPLEIRPVQCHDEADFPGHGDIQGSDQRNMAEHICDFKIFDDLNDEDPKLSADADSDEHTYFGTDNYGIDYVYYVHWRPGCKTSIDSQSLQEPVPGHKCEDIYKDTYRDCPSNGGVGGYIDAGCLRWEFWGGKKPEEIFPEAS